MFRPVPSRIWFVAASIGLFVAAAGAAAGADSPRGYADPNTCAACHSEIADRYAQTGMARTFGALRGAGDGHLANVTFTHAPSAETIAVSRTGAGFQMERHQTGFTGGIVNSLAAKLDYWIGSGDHARSYLSRTPGGELIELPLTWYSEKNGYWAMSPGYDSPSHAGFSRKVTYRCMFCHNAYPVVPPGADRMDNATKFPADLAQGIDCQRCHGPGLHHVQAALAGRPASELKKLIVNPATLPLERRDEVCLQCHLEPTSLTLPAALPVYGRGVFSYDAGEPLDRYMRYFDHAPGTGHGGKFEFAGAPYRLRKSKCFTASQSSLTCITCHDPHQPDRVQVVARSNAACVNCHRAIADTNDRDHTPAANCVACHMQPRRPSDAIRVTITDHDIQRRPSPVADPVVEMNSANQPPYRGEVAAYYPPVDDLYTAIAQVKNQANLQQGIARLEKAIAAAQPANAEIWTDLADAYRHASQSSTAIPNYRKAISLDPTYWPAWHGLGLAMAATGDLHGSLGALDRAVSESGGDEAAFRSRALILTQMGRQPEAVATLRDGLAVHPDSAALRNDLGAALLRAGNGTAAEAALREAVRLRPESSAIRLNLANLLMRSDRFEEAAFEFQAAIRTDPSSAQAHSGYGTALASKRRFSAARGELRAALALNPELPNVHNNLGAVLKELGDNEGAAAEYRAAIEIDPAYATARYNLAVILELQNRMPEAIEQLRSAIRVQPGYGAAQLKLGELLLKAGKPAEALPHLREAARSSQSNIAGEARAALAGQR
jgi:tetratricopeptide (TPR) repeat protein